MACRAGCVVSFPAKYAGQCVECGCRIQVDDEIERGTEGGYVHVTCPEDIPTKPTKFQGTDLESMGF
jgi:hypothetical protein